jgi:cysteine desulfurase
MQRIYLDYAAATPVDSRVFEDMKPFFSDVYYNPSALYQGAREAKSSLEEARHKVAAVLGAKPSEIIFTAGGTESANLAIIGIMNQYKDGEIIVSAIEHDAVLKPAEEFDYKIAPVDKKGIIKLDELENLISDKTVLISVMLANNEVGSLQPLKEIVDTVQKVLNIRKSKKNKTPLFVHTDACQAPLYLDLNIARLGVDMMTLNGGKMHGPKQSGILYKKSSVILKPLINGGGQEWGIRSGTENVAFAVGFARALELASKSRTQRAKDISSLRDYFIDRLEIEFSAELTGSKAHRLANNVHVIFPNSDNERVLFSLDDMGVDAAAGSACSASNDTPSHVLLAMGYEVADAQSSIRFSLGKSTTKENIDEVIDKLKIALHA